MACASLATTAPGGGCAGVPASSGACAPDASGARCHGRVLMWSGSTAAFGRRAGDSRRASHSAGAVLRDHGDVNGLAVATIASLTRATQWRLISELPMKCDAHHPQGMTKIGSTWWISTVDVEARHGYVLVVDSDGDLLERVPVGDDQRYHPGGMDFDGVACWIPAAEYRPDSTTTVYRLEPGGVPVRAFDVNDHVGALARCGNGGDLVGWSWGSRRFFRWSAEGDLRASRPNPAFFVDYQDCQWFDGGHLLCGGVADVGLSSGRGWLGGIALLDTNSLRIERAVPFPEYSSATGRVGTHNPIWAEVNGNDLIIHLLPDDGRSAILSYSTPLVGED